MVQAPSFGPKLESTRQGRFLQEHSWAQWALLALSTLGETIYVQDGSPKQPSLPFTNKHPGQGIPSAGAPVPQPAAALTSDRRTCIITSYRQQETKCASDAEAERPIVINHSRPCTLDRTKTKPTVFLCWYALKTLPTISHKGPVCPALSLSQATAFGIGYGKGNSHKKSHFTDNACRTERTPPCFSHTEMLPLGWTLLLSGTPQKPVTDHQEQDPSIRETIYPVAANISAKSTSVPKHD